jgi:hypothetical protein
VQGVVRRHPVDAWRLAAKIVTDRRGTDRLRAAYEDDRRVRRTIDALRAIGAGADPAAAALTRMEEAFSQGAEVRREIVSLRAVQSLAVLDIRNYRELVFELGDYAADGEDSAAACGLP